MKIAANVVYVLTALLCAAGTVTADIPAKSQVADQPMIGELAPSFSLMDVNGQRISTDSLRGSYVIIHFAASW